MSPSSESRGVVEEDSLLHQLLEIAYRETRADFACLYMFDQGQISAHIWQTPHLPPEHHIASQELAQAILENSRQIILNHQSASTWPQHQTWLDQLKAQDVIATPLRSKETGLGALILTRTTGFFALGDAAFLAVLAGQAGIALENARLFTQIQEAYEELKTLDHLKSEFINIAAHELRTPLAIITGYASMLEEDMGGLHRDYITIISRCDEVSQIFHGVLILLSQAVPAKCSCGVQEFWYVERPLCE